MIFTREKGCAEHENAIEYECFPVHLNFENHDIDSQPSQGATLSDYFGYLKGEVEIEVRQRVELALSDKTSALYQCLEIAAEGFQAMRQREQIDE